MKVSAATLAALLLLALCSPAVALTDLPHLDDVPTTCCFSYMHRPIPRGFIASAHITSSICTQPGVILVTKKGRELCADPQAPWVQAHLEHFQKTKN